MKKIVFVKKQKENIEDIMNKKPDCYECKYRGEVSGSAHSSCQHSSLKEITENPLMNIMSILGSVRGGIPPISKKGGIKVVGNPQGIRGGWFNHPLNFDPVWLESCDGFEQKLN